jgi:hypothetical protein
MPQTKTPTKRQLTKLAHQRAIEEFEKWLILHPTATRKKKVRHFDFLVDSAELDMMVNG